MSSKQKSTETNQSAQGTTKHPMHIQIGSVQNTEPFYDVLTVILSFWSF